MGVDPGSLALKAGMMALQMGLTMMNKIEGPRLDSLDVTTADFGTPMTYFWGKRRLEGCPIIWAEKLREKKTTSKTKGGKYAEYKYYGTFGVLIADHAIDAVTRIWMDKHLVYDLTNIGPISVFGSIFQGINGSPVKIMRGRNMRIYDGTQTEPDPRMEAWCEDRYGADSCPAYKDLSYIVFEDLPLEKFGNRIPQITIEAVSAKTTSTPYETHPTDISANGAFVMSPNAGWMMYWDGNVEWWNVPSRQLVGTSTLIYDFGGIDNIVLDEAGNAWYVGQEIIGVDIASALIKIPPCGPASIAYDMGIVDATLNGSSRHFWYGGVYSGHYEGGYWFNGIRTSEVNSYRDFFRHDNGDLWAITQPVGSSDQISLVSVTGTGGFTFTGLVTRSAVSTATALHVAEYGHFFVVSDGKFYIIDDQTGLILSSGADTWSRNPNPMYSPNATVWFGDSNKEYSLKDGSLIRTLSLPNPGTVNRWIYEPLTHSRIARPPSEANLYWSYIDRIDGAEVDLGDVVSDVATWCGATVDVSDLDQTVTGYSVTQGSGKDMVGPLLDIHDVDARPHDFSLQFLKRGGAVQGTVETSEFVREGDENRYAVTIKQDTDLPLRISLTFADENKDQQTNTVLSQRPGDAADSKRTQQIDLGTYVATPAEAQQYSDRYFRRLWNERESITNGLTPQMLALEPGDNWNLSLDGVTRYARCTKVTIGQTRLDTEWVRDAVSFNTLGTGEGADMDGRDDDEIFVPDMTKGFVLDIPLVQDAHSNANPLLYYGAGSFGGDWPGAAIFEADLDLDEYTTWNGVTAADKATWGYANDELPNANPNLWDRGSSINVRVFGTLTSCTEADIDATPTTNLALLGNELINFVTATLETDGSYTLSTFKRGRRGTEWACGDHATGEEFVLASDLDTDAVGLSSVGEELDFKAQTLGGDIAPAATIAVDFTGATLKPYAPVVECVYKESSGDLKIRLRSRTRLGATWNGTTIPTGEASESYEFDVYRAGVFKRTLTSSTKTLTYSAANQTTDGGSIAASALDGNAYQLSASVGRGFARAP